MRPNLEDDEFALHFASMGIDPKISLWIRTEIDGYKHAGEILVHWDDEIWNFYRIDGEEIEFIIERAFSEFEIPKPNPSDPELVPNMSTVKSCILYLDHHVKMLAATSSIA